MNKPWLRRYHKNMRWMLKRGESGFILSIILVLMFGISSEAIAKQLKKKKKQTVIPPPPEFICPVDNSYISSDFGSRKDPFSGKHAWHSGIDLCAKEGSTVKAIEGGRVIFSGIRGRYGKLLEIEHANGLITRYGHNKELFVKPGQTVKKGQKIASIGKTGRASGPHLHFEVRKNGKAVDPVEFFPELKKLFSKD